MQLSLEILYVKQVPDYCYIHYCDPCNTESFLEAHFGGKIDSNYCDFFTSKS